MKMTYLNALDTTLFVQSFVSNNEDMTRNFILADALLKYSILTGIPPIVSQTQIMDSDVILSADENEQKAFFELVKRADIKIILHKRKNLKEAIVANLTNENFKFSSIKFSDEKKEEMTIRTRLANSIQSGTEFTGNSEIQRYQAYLCLLTEATEKVSFMKTRDSLYTLEGAVSGYGKTHNNEFLTNGIKAGLLHSNEKNLGYNLANTRSWWYSWIEDSLFDDENDRKEHKALIDQLYNHVVFSSYGDNAIFIKTTEAPYGKDMSDIFNTNEKTISPIRIIEKEYMSEILTWDTVNKISDDVQKLKPSERGAKVLDMALSFFRENMSNIEMTLERQGKQYTIRQAVEEKLSFINIFRSDYTNIESSQGGIA